MGRRPDFFIVGAPKSGTSSLFTHLGRHPEIFVPDLKEPHFFGADHDRLNHRPLTPAQYQSLFQGADGARRVGEGSTSYLHSRTAAREIAAYQPHARIIVMLREPVAMMHALHGEMVASGFEQIVDFAAALEAESRRKAGELLPRFAAGLRENLYYRETAAYAEQLDRYFQAFGRQRVLLILFEDWASDTPGTYRRALDFLGVSPGFSPDLHQVVNGSKRPRSMFLQRSVFEPPEIVLRTARSLVPQPVRGRVRYGLRSLNTVAAPRDPIPPALAAQLSQELRGEVERLEQLLDRSLPAWKASSTRKAAGSR